MMSRARSVTQIGASIEYTFPNFDSARGHGLNRLHLLDILIFDQRLVVSKTTVKWLSFTQRARSCTSRLTDGHERGLYTDDER